MHSRRRYLRSARSQPRRAALQAVVGIIALIGSLVVAVPASAVSGAPGAVSSASSLTEAATVDSGFVKAAAVVGFNPENIISDALFYDGNAMSAAEIQSFLDSKIGRCENGKCLNVLTASISSRDAWYSQATGDLVCSALQGGTMRVSELIYRVQVACGISAKVILVTLQKEQGLTTSSAPSDWNLRAAMGASCPDTEPCDPAYSGVGPQIVQGVRQLKIYKAGRFAKQPGVNFIGYNPNSACGGTNLNIQNYATAALYNYTPYQPNAAALAAGWGLGDGCSSYGNRNFYNYYTSWFGSTQGSVDPFGALDVVEAQPGVFKVRGWAIDPDTSDPIQVHVWVDNVAATTFTANIERPDVAAVYSAFGAAHGFEGEVSALGSGKRSVCAYAINVLRGGNVKLGCATLTAMSGPPFGYLDAADAVAGGIRVSGWAIDPDTTGPVDVEIRVDGVVTSTGTADLARADILRAYPVYGGKHGYSLTVPAAVGSRSMCVVAKNTRSGTDTQLGCRDVNVAAPSDAGRAPLGSLDEVKVVGRTVVVGGWAWDQDSSTAVGVRVSTGEAGTLTAATGSRPDVAGVYPSAGTSRGFSTSLRLEPGTHRVCAVAVNAGLGADTQLGCRDVTILAPRDTVPSGSLDEVTTSAGAVTVRGWGFDPDGPGAIGVQISIDGVSTTYLADKTRTDIGRVHPLYGEQHGFVETVSASAGRHEVCASALNDLDGAAVALGCRTVTVPAPAADRLPIGQVDEMTVSAGQVTVRGWVIDPDTSEPIVVHVYVDDAVTKGRADQARPDIAQAYPEFGSPHGYTMTIPTAAGTHRVCVYGIGDVRDGNSQIGCRTVTVP